MPRMDKTPMAVTATGNIQFMTPAEMCQQSAVFCTVPGMITFKSVQLFIYKTGQVLLHPGAMKIAGQMGAERNAARIMDYLHYF